jgi:hypothetical protein
MVVLMKIEIFWHCVIHVGARLEDSIEIMNRTGTLSLGMPRKYTEEWRYSSMYS